MDFKIKISLICSLFVLFSLTFASKASESNYLIYVILYIFIHSVPYFILRKYGNCAVKSPKSSVENKIYLSSVILSASLLFSFILTGIFNDSNVSSYSFNTETLIFSGIIVPVLEEVFWRGTVTCGLLSAGKITASVISSVLFGFLHSGISGLIYGVFAGILFSVLYISTGSLIPGIVIHIINNIAAILSIRFPFIVIPVYVTSAVSAIVFYLISRRKGEHNISIDNSSIINIFSEPFLYISLIIFMMYRYLLV